nr:hypothetical protein [Kutzneria sp. CA-103260]
MAEAGQLGANARVTRFAAHGSAVGALGGGDVAGPPSGVAQHEVGPHVVGLVSNGLGGGVHGVGPTAGGTEGLGQGDAAPPVGGRGLDGLASGGDGLLMTGKTAERLAGQAVRRRLVAGKR